MQWDQLRTTATRTSGWVAAIGTLGGFIGDVLQPLGDIAEWVATIALLLTLLSGVGWFVLYRQRGQQVWESVMPAIFLVAGPTFLVFSLWSALFDAGPERGYLADNLDPIAQLQSQLLGLEEDVAAIRTTTEQTRAEVERVATAQATAQAQLESIEESSDAGAQQLAAIATAQAQSFAEIQASFASLQANQTIVENPTTPQEWYSNARLFQLRGDSANAIEALEGYLAFDLPYLDPLLRYVTLLNVTEGIGRTRERIGQRMTGRLREQGESPTLALVAATLEEEPAERIARLEPLAQEHPEYGPLWNELGKAYDQQLRQGQTRELLQKQEAAYRTLFELEAAQNFSRYYIDKELAAEALAEARVSLDTWQVSREVTNQPSFFINHTIEGTLFTVAVAEMGYQALRWDIDNPEPARESGTVDGGALGRIPNPSIGPIVVEPGEHTFFYQYIDKNGTPSPVFEEPFTIYPISIQYVQQPGDFAAGTSDALFVISMIEAEESSIWEYRYSLDEPGLGDTLPGYPMNSLTIPDLAQGAHTLYIQATGPDGSTTDLVAYPFTVE